MIEVLIGGLIVAGIGVELFAVVQASRRGEHIRLGLLAIGIALLCLGLILDTLASGGAIG